MITRRSLLAGTAVAALTPAMVRTATADDDLVRVGAAVSLSGKLAREGRLLHDGYAYWEKLVNDAGGINVGGRKTKVHVVYYDDESDAQTSARLTERCISEDKCQFMFGPYSSGIATATAAISEKYRIITIDAMANADNLFTRGYRYYFAPAPIASHMLDPMVDMLKALPMPPNALAIAGPDDLFPNVVGAAVQKRAGALGLKVAYSGKFPKTALDLSPVVTAIKQANADALILTGYAQDSIQMVKTLQSLRVNPKFIGFAFAVGIPDVLNALGPASEQLAGIALWDATLSYKGPIVADSAAYVAGFKKQFGKDPSVVAAGGTVAGVVLQSAIEKAGSLDATKVRDALLTLDFDTFFGRVKFDKNGVDVTATTVVLQVQNGKAFPIYPEAIRLAPIQYPRKAFA